MALSVKHAFQSAKADAADSSKVRASNWNAEHTLTVGAGAFVGAPAAGAVQELSQAQAQTLIGLDTDGTMAANSATKIPAQSAVVTYVAAAISALRDGVSSAYDTLAEIATALAAQAAVTLTAGAGLTGGGDLSANRSFAVGAGTGITVNADDVALDTSHARNVDHSGVTITGTGNLNGGGTIEASRTLDMANMAQSTIKGRAAGAGTGTPTDLSATQATAILNAVVGDSGSGGTKGLVPAPAAGDAAASKFLKADGTWAATSGSGDLVSTNNLSDVANASTARLNLGVAPSIPQGRLSLQTGVSVMTTTQSAKTTIYYTPHVGRHVPLYDGTRWKMHDIGGELSQATTDNTKSPAAATTDSNYDLFVWSDSGTYRCTRGPAWSSGTGRGTGAGTTELEQIAGIWTNKVSITNGPAANRGTYVGTVRTNGSSQVDWIYGALASGGTAAVLGVWNMYNRVAVSTIISDSTDSWTYAVATTWRAANGSATMRASFIVGLADDAIDAIYACISSVSTTNTGAAGVGLDTTTSYSGLSAYLSGPSGAVCTAPAIYSGVPGIGWHYVSANEYREGGTITFYGDGGAASYIQSGLRVNWRA